MINGITNAGGYPASFITKVQPATPRTPTVPVDNERPPELTVPKGDQRQLVKEHTELTVASRQFSRLLPVIEMANADVN